MSDARQISDNYADLVTLAARQALAVDITMSKDSQGQWNTSDVMTFMKDVGNLRWVVWVLSYLITRLAYSF